MSYFSRFYYAKTIVNCARNRGVLTPFQAYLVDKIQDNLYKSRTYRAYGLAKMLSANLRKRRQK